MRELKTSKRLTVAKGEGKGEDNRLFQQFFFPSKLSSNKKKTH
jgi:hypothetical protein